MKREILNLKLKKIINGCCPGHDDWPDETYKSNLSKRARAKSIKKEHQFVRRINKKMLAILLKANCIKED